MARKYDADGTKVAAADYSSTGQYLAVALSTSVADTVALCASDGERAYGILQNNPIAGAAAEVAVEGECFAMAGATVTRNDVLKAEVTTARLIPIAADGDYALAVALESAADGGIFKVRITKAGIDQAP